MITLWQRLLLMVFLFACAATSSYSIDEMKLPPDCGQTLLEVNYSTIKLKNNIFAYICKGSTYLPVIDILNNLKVYNKVDYSEKTVDGYFNTRDSSFYLNFKMLKAVVFKNEMSFSRTDFISDGLEFYARPEFFEQIFNFKIDINLSSLSISIESDFALPVLRLYNRQKSYSFIAGSDLESELNYSTLRYDRDRSIINGGLLNYNLTATQNSSYRNYSLSTNLGIELLGGDFQVSSVSGYAEQHKKFIYNNMYRWRYNFGDNPYLTNITLGNLGSAGSYGLTMLNTSFLGLQLTNEKPKYSSFYMNKIIEDNIQPGWEVELYKNGMLVSHTETDSLGYYRFVLPLYYGRTNITLRLYGPKGQFEEKNELIQATPELLPPGELYYYINLGRRDFDKSLFYEGKLNLGLTSWLSNSFSIRGSKDKKKFDFYNSLSLSIFSNLNTIIDYSPEKFYSLALNLMTIDYGQYRISYLNYQNINDDIFFKGLKSKAEINYQLPNILKLPVNFFGVLQRSDYESNCSYIFSSNLFFNFNTFFFTILYRANTNILKFPGENDNSIFHSASANISYMVRNKPKFLKFMDNIILSLASNYDFTTRRPQNLRLSLSTTMLKDMNLYCGLEKSLVYNSGISTFLRLGYDFNAFKSFTNMNSFGNTFSLSQEISGFIGYNTTTNEVLSQNNSGYTSIGMGAVSFRAFLDDNNNGSFDKGEKIIKGFRVDIPNSNASYGTSGDMSQAFNLLPYARYNAVIDLNSLKNPLWKPKWTEFSFVADPNCLKQIDVPFYCSGIIEGKIISQVGGKKRSQGGVKIHIESIDSSYHETFPVFSDGSFYIMGVPAGDYKVFIDPSQLSILNTRPDPEFITITVKSTSDGDYIDDLNFTLYPAEGETYKNVKK